MEPFLPTESIMPASYVQQLARLVARWSVTPACLLAGTGVDDALLAQSRGHISPRQYTALITRARALTGEPALAVWWGRQMRLSWHGSVGFAVFASSTLREALEVAVRFLPLRSPEMSLTWRVAGPEVEITLEHRCEGNIAAEYNLMALLIFLTRASEELLGEMPEMHAALTIPEPLWFHAQAASIPVRLTFNAPANCAWFPAHYLDIPLNSGDPAAWEKALEQCEQELQAIAVQRGLAGRLRRLVLDWPSGIPSQQEAAAALNLSVRTLARRLEEDGNSYRVLVDDVLCARACALFELPGTTVESVAEALGYSDAANFTRAFRRWSGSSPRAYRKAR